MLEAAADDAAHTSHKTSRSCTLFLTCPFDLCVARPHTVLPPQLFSDKGLKSMTKELKSTEVPTGGSASL